MASQFDFLDSFSDRAEAHALKKRWTASVGFAPKFVAGAGRFSGQQVHRIDGFNGLKLDYGGSSVRGASGFTSKVGFGAAIKTTSSQGVLGGTSIFQTIGVNVAPGSKTLMLRFTTDGRLAIYDAGSLLPGTECNLARPLFTNIFYFIEWEVTFHESAIDGTEHLIDSRIYIEGVQVLNITSYSLGFPSAPNSRYINPSIIQFMSAQDSGYVTDYCDFYFRTAGIFGSGLRILNQHPEADSLIEFDEPVSGDHFDEVDELLLDTTDYIRSVAAPEIDQFALEDLPASVDPSRTVKMVQFEFHCEGDEDGDGIFLRNHVSQGATDVTHSENATSGLYQTVVYDSDPFAPGTLLASEFDSVAAGVMADTF